MKTVLTLAACYTPGQKAGGPIKSLVNLHRALDQTFRIHLLTSDRDLGEARPYPDVPKGKWTPVEKTLVRYLAPEEQNLLTFKKLVDEVNPDLLYLNSFFSPRFTIQALVARRLGMLSNRPVLLAPRGEFSAGALGLKRFKKKAYLRLAKQAGLLEGLYWHASTPLEAADVLRAIAPLPEDVLVACDLGDPIPEELPTGPRDHDPTLHVAFLARISPMKNLDYALDVLSRVTLPVHFNLYGPSEDAEYAAACLDRLDSLPNHITTTHHGAVDTSTVPTVLRANDLLFLPTRGENFGHVIAESLAVGTPVLISDRTPWRDLQAKGLGDDLSLDNPDAFVERIHSAAEQSPQQRQERRRRTHNAFRDHCAAKQDIEENRQMFMSVIERGAQRNRPGDG